MSRKLLLICLMVAAVFLVGIGIVIVLQITQNPLPGGNEASSSSSNSTDIPVAGFGSTAIRDNFTVVEQAFAGLDCTWYLNEDLLRNTGNPLIDELAVEFNHGRDRELEVTNDYAKNCFYYFYDANLNFKIVEFYVKAYQEDSAIDSDAQALFNRINSRTLINQIEDGYYLNSIKYFYGESHIDNTCQINMFHEQNDFEYASVLFHSFGTCELYTGVSRDLAFIIAEKLEKVMEPFLLDS